MRAWGRTGSEQVVQRRDSDPAGTPGKRTLTEPHGDEAIHTAQRGVAGGGGPLPHLAEIQAAFGPDHDVSGVRAHVGGDAAAASEQMGAEGYAISNDVAFAKLPSLQLAAHEAAHVVQQRAGVQLSRGVGESGDQYEQHADAVADRVVQGKSAADLLDAGPARGGAGTAVQHQKPKPNAVHLPAHVDNSVVPKWTEGEIKKIQTELRRLGLYRLTVDGDLGAKTDSALVEAFGDNTWRTMTAATALARLEKAKPPAGDKGEHALRYGEMFADGLLDMTLGVGFDETSAHKGVLKQMETELAAHSFKVDNALGIQLYKEAKRAVPANPFGTFWVRPNALTYTPPAGAPRKIHAVVRLVSSADGKQGAEAAAAFKEGMVESDVTFYSGHGRYGSGPDFDRNFTVELLDDKKALEAFFDSYDKLETHLTAEGKPHKRDAWAQFQWRLAKGRVVVKGDNKGNVRMRKDNNRGAFGAKLMYWNLNRTGTGAAPVTGKGGELDKQAAAHPERKYRVMVFNGCKTDDYEGSLRATPGMDSHATDTFASTQTLYWNNNAATMAAFLDSILKMQSAEDTAKAMDDVQTTTGKAGTGTMKAYGASDNPVYK